MKLGPIPSVTNTRLFHNNVQPVRRNAATWASRPLNNSKRRCLVETINVITTLIENGSVSR